MGRISDTRMKTREAAARLMAGGKRAHELTVDAIYAEIRQGSRTTINDELKCWKDEQAKGEVLSASLPVEISAAMMSIWAAAVEQGERAFAQRREEVEAELAQALARQAMLEAALAERERETESQRLREAALDSALGQAQAKQAALAAALETARAQERAQQSQLETMRREHEALQAARTAAHAEREAALEAKLQAQEVAFRAELDRAMARLEGVQQHVLRQVTEAREATRQAEASLAKVQQRADSVSATLRQTEQALAHQHALAEQQQLALTQLALAKQALAAECETLRTHAVELGEQLSRQCARTEWAEQQAQAVQARLDRLLGQRPLLKKRRPAGLPGGQGR